MLSCFSTVAGSAEEADAMKVAMGNFTPLKRVGTPAEIAAAALYLATGDSAFVLGAEYCTEICTFYNICSECYNKRMFGVD